MQITQCKLGLFPVTQQVMGLVHIGKSLIDLFKRVIYGQGDLNHIAALFCFGVFTAIPIIGTLVNLVALNRLRQVKPIEIELKETPSIFTFENASSQTITSIQVFYEYEGFDFNHLFRLNLQPGEFYRIRCEDISEDKLKTSSVKLIDLKVNGKCVFSKEWANNMRFVDTNGAYNPKGEDRPVIKAE